MTNSKYLYLRIDLLKSIHRDLVSVAAPNASLSANWMQRAIHVAEDPTNDWAVAFFLCQAAKVLRDCDQRTLRELADDIDLALEEFRPTENPTAVSSEQHLPSQ